MDNPIVTIIDDYEIQAIIRSFFTDDEWIKHEKDLEIQKWILAMILEEDAER